MKHSKILSFWISLFIMVSTYASGDYPETKYMPICDTQGCVIKIENFTQDAMKIITANAQFDITPGTSAMVQQKLEEPDFNACNSTYAQHHTYTVTAQLLSASGQPHTTFTQTYQIGCGTQLETPSNEISWYDFWLGYLVPTSAAICTSGCDPRKYDTSYRLGGSPRFDDNGIPYYNTLIFSVLQK